MATLSVCICFLLFAVQVTTQIPPNISITWTDPLTNPTTSTTSIPPGSTFCPIDCESIVAQITNQENMCSLLRTSFACYETNILNNDSCAEMQKIVVRSHLKYYQENLNKYCNVIPVVSHCPSCEVVQSYPYNHEEQCSSLFHAIKCIHNSVISSSDCDSQERLNGQLRKGYYRQLYESYCATSSSPKCDISVCERVYSANQDTLDACTRLSHAMNCLEDIVTSSSDCDSQERLKGQLQQGYYRKLYESKCARSSSGLSPECDISVCERGFSVDLDTAEACTNATDEINCAQTVLRTSMGCSDDDKLAIQMAIDLSLTYVNSKCKNITIPGKCDIDTCWKVSIFPDQKELCKVVPLELECFKKILSTDADCNEIHKKNLNETINAANEYMKTKCDSCLIQSSLTLCLGLTMLAYFLIQTK